MRSTFRLSFALKNTYRVNGILYSLKQIPLLRRLLPQALYRSRGLKRFAGLLAAVWELLTAFLGKLLYMLTMVTGVGVLYENAARGTVFLHILLCLTVIGGFMNTGLFNPTRDKYYAMILMRMDARSYTLVNYAYTLVKVIVGFLPFTLFFGLANGVPLWLCLVLPFSIAGCKLTAAALTLRSYEKRGRAYNENAFNKRSWLLAALLLAAALLTACMAGCTGKTEQPAKAEATEKAEPAKDSTPADEEITLTFWHTYGDAEEAQFLNVVLPLWEAAHPNIRIEAVRQDGGQFHEMIVTSFGTGMSPDVARVDIANIAAYAKQGGLVALSDYADFAEISGNYLDAPLSTNLYQGKYYGLPLDTNCKAAVVNTNVLKEIGLDTVPKTMEAFIEAAKDRGSYSLNVSGVGDWDMYPYFWLFGGTLTDDGFTKATGYLDSEKSIAAMNKLIELHEQKIFTIRDVDGSVDAWDGINSEYAMFFEGPWYFGSYDDCEAKGIVAATIPTYEGRSASVVGGEDIAVFSTSEQKDAAYEFAKFMTSEEVQLAMLQSGQLPILKSLVENEAVTSNPVWSVYMKQMESAKARIPSPNNAAIQEIWSEMVTSIFVEGADAAQAMHDAAAKIDGQLS